MLNRFGHVERMTNDTMVEKCQEWKSMSTGLAGRTKIRWKNDRRENIRIMEINWIKCIQDRVKWKDALENATTFKQ